MDVPSTDNNRWAPRRSRKPRPRIHDVPSTAEGPEDTSLGSNGHIHSWNPYPPLREIAKGGACRFFNKENKITTSEQKG